MVGELVSSAIDREIQARQLAEAAAWRSYLSETGAESSEAFEAWLGDSGNEAAWRQVQGPWELFGEHAAAPEVLAARRAALGRAREAGRSRFSGKSRLRGVAAAAVLVAVAGGVIFWNLNQPDVYRTRLGERRVVTLVDGSRISLDSESDVRVKLSKKARELSLLAGQARFDVAHDVTRPFSVVAGDEKIIATGTAFNVDLAGQTVRVTLIEGRVTVIDQRSSLPGAVSVNGQPARAARSGRVELHSGEQLVATPAAAPEVILASLERTTAWQNGQLFFEDEPLSSVAARVSRYSNRPLTVGDERAGELKISGVFNTGDLDGFVETITHYLPVRVEPGENGALVLRRSD
jgi:transmembrane sensor